MGHGVTETAVGAARLAAGAAARFLARWVPLLIVNLVFMGLTAQRLWGAGCGAGGLLGCLPSLALSVLFLVGFPALYWAILLPLTLRRALVSLVASRRDVLESACARPLAAALARLPPGWTGGQTSGQLRALVGEVEAETTSALGAALQLPALFTPVLRKLVGSATEGPVPQGAPAAGASSDDWAVFLARQLVERVLKRARGGAGWPFVLTLIVNGAVFVGVMLLA
ncbi:MAG: hypothetical protein QM767_08615 [Anaeromyxobacter sp.]